LAASFTAANTVFAQAYATDQQQSLSASSNTSDKSGTIKSVQTDVQVKWNLDSNLFPGISNILSSIFNYVYLQCHIRNVPVPFFST